MKLKYSKNKPGYHLAQISKGVVGESSKIKEEVAEFLDAESQGSRVMVIIELSDLLGAVETYIEKQKLGVAVEDLLIMSRITQRAFRNGHRS